MWHPEKIIAGHPTGVTLDRSLLADSGQAPHADFEATQKPLFLSSKYTVASWLNRNTANNNIVIIREVYFFVTDWTSFFFSIYISYEK